MPDEEESQKEQSKKWNELVCAASSKLRRPGGIDPSHPLSTINTPATAGMIWETRQLASLNSLTLSL